MKCLSDTFHAGMILHCALKSVEAVQTLDLPFTCAHCSEVRARGYPRPAAAAARARIRMARHGTAHTGRGAHPVHDCNMLILALYSWAPKFAGAR